jgi:arabinose-5-phosphate isomerase
MELRNFKLEDFAVYHPEVLLAKIIACKDMLEHSLKPAVSADASIKVIFEISRAMPQLL